MNRTIAICLTLFLSSESPLLAQETVASPGSVEVMLTPAGGTFFTSGSGPDFGNYTYGGALTINLNRFVGFEADLAGSTGIAQDLEFGNTTMNAKSPNTFMYLGDVVISVPTGRPLIPYVAASAGGLTMFERAAVNVRDSQTFFGATSAAVSNGMRRTVGGAFGRTIVFLRSHRVHLERDGSRRRDGIDRATNLDGSRTIAVDETDA